MTQRIKTLLAICILAGALVGIAAADSNQDEMDLGGAAFQRGDYAQAAMWYQKAADGGNAIAWTLLGNMRENGQGLLQDYVEAVTWYQKAADYGYAPSEIALGEMYLHGYGVAQDYVHAHMLFNLASAHAIDAFTRDFAGRYRDEVAAKMTPAQIAEAQRMAREWVRKPRIGRVP